MAKNRLDEITAMMEWSAGQGLAVVSYAQGDFRMKISRGAPVAITATSPVNTAHRAAAAKPAAGVAAPLAGICHLSPAPGAPPFVAPGDRVVPGQTLCLLEAMKVMTAVVAEYAGQVSRIAVTDGAAVTAGDPLIEVTP